MTVVLLFFMLGVGVTWAFDIFTSGERSIVEVILAGGLIGFSLTNLLYTFTGI